MTPYALFFLAFAFPIALIAAIWATRRPHGGGRRGPGRVVVAVAGWVVVVGSVYVVSGWALPDAVDGVPDSRRAMVASALRGSPDCGMFPLARVSSVSVQSRPEVGTLSVGYRCGPGYLGVPSVSGSATCIEGNWTYTERGSVSGEDCDFNGG